MAGAYAVIIDVERFSRFKRALAVVVGIWAMIYGTQTILAFAPPI